MLEFNVPPLLALESMMLALRVAAKECRMRRWLIGLLVLALAGIVAGVSATVLARQGDPSPATGTATSSGPTPSPSPDPGATEPPSTGLARFYSQRLAWAACGENECSTPRGPPRLRAP